MRQAARDLKGNQSKRERDAQRQARDAAKKAEALRKKAEEEQAKKNKLEEHKIFELDFDPACRPKVFASWQDFDKAVGDKEFMWDTPFVVGPCNELAFLQMKQLAIGRTMEQWVVQYRGSSHCKGPDKRTQAPLTAVMGATDIQRPLAQLCAEGTHQVNCAKAPEVDKMTSTYWLFGYMETLVTHLFEPGCLATARIITSGDLSFVLVAVQAFQFCCTCTHTSKQTTPVPRQIPGHDFAGGRHAHFLVCRFGHGRLTVFIEFSGSQLLCASRCWFPGFAVAPHQGQVLQGQ